ncbi:MAG: histidine--tRNA ligase [Bacillota bacterium]|nr:histidine--tRNA ligase [Bacillota bacterium]
MLLTSAPRGTFDVLPKEVGWWHHLRGVADRTCAQYGYEEIITPAFEHTELFVRTTGETSDIVMREMYTFQDRSERSLTLRPEGTPGAGRAYLEHKLFLEKSPTRLYYFGPMFRYERPQAGRQRQFNQFGVEVFGAESYLADAEVIALGIDFLSSLGLKSLEVQLNSIGCDECRPRYRGELVSYFQTRAEGLCEDCRRRLERNPLRILDCKNEQCRAVSKGAPVTLDYLCPACSTHFEALSRVLRAEGISFEINTSLVRGLDYYTRTVFEFIYGGLGSQNAILAGGRYDGLISSLGGDAAPAVGWALGIERLVMTLEKEGVTLPESRAPSVYVIAASDTAAEGFAVARQLRREGCRAEMDLLGRGFKAQMKQADKAGARWAVFVGGDEIAKHRATVRDMKSRVQQEVEFDRVAEFIKSNDAGRSGIDG